jgi:flagellar biosynthesis/type III secretory pathway M-ring protein FliF/YscJ
VNQWFFNLAAIKIGEGILDTKTMSFAAKEVALVLFGLVALAVALIVWVGFIRKRPRHRDSSGRQHHHRHHHRDSAEAGSSAEADSQPEVTASKSESHHSGKRRHVKFRRRFPTLAQTGGLPPKRPLPDEPAESPGSSAPS